MCPSGAETIAAAFNRFLDTLNLKMPIGVRARVCVFVSLEPVLSRNIAGICKAPLVLTPFNGELVDETEAEGN